MKAFASRGAAFVPGAAKPEYLPLKSRLLVSLLSMLTAGAAQAITTLPETSMTAPASGLREEQPTCASYGNPEWTQHRRFSTTRVFIQKNPWEVGIEQ